MGTVAGTINLRNRGPGLCALKGFPGLAILDDKGPVAADVVHTAQSPAGLAAAATELLPGQTSTVYMQWVNFCGSLSGPVALSLAFSGGVARITPAQAASISGRPFAPVCGTRKLPSSLLVSSFQPGPDPGVVGLLSFYAMLNEHLYSDAYAEVIDPGISRAQFIAGYRQTKQVRVDLIAVPTHVVSRGSSAYECIGIRLTARQTRGPALAYGGWVMVEVQADKRVLVVIAGSHVVADGRLLVPDLATCASSIPTNIS
jgi:hypothetical protein